ncbi:MFS general substrate transporter [Hymenopellis radicata]|nr:MFS general substrate transporter [Hymenopellis radicata]
MSDAKLPADVSVKDSSVSSVTGVSEYDEYLQLAEEFKGDRLRKTIRKVDRHLLPMLIFIYLLSYIDRTNVGNAKLFGALDDLGMSSQDWNTGLCVFFVTYSLGAVPANLALSRFGPKIWIPFILAMVSIILIIHGLVSNRGGWYTMRLLLGWFEAGIYPGCSYVLTTWYNTYEIQKRLTFFYSGACAAGAFSGLLAYGIGQLDYVWGYRGWRFIYVIEGLFTFCVACFAYFVVLPSPNESGKWLHEDERKFLVLRHKYSAGGGVAEKTNFDWNMNNMGYSNAKSQAMSAPPYVFACFVTFASGWFADRYQQRMLAMVLPACLALTGYAIAVGTVSHSNLTGVTCNTFNRTPENATKCLIPTQNSYPDPKKEGVSAPRTRLQKMVDFYPHYASEVPKPGTRRRRAALRLPNVKERLP